MTTWPSDLPFDMQCATIDDDLNVAICQPASVRGHGRGTGAGSASEGETGTAFPDPQTQNIRGHYFSETNIGTLGEYRVGLELRSEEHTSELQSLTKLVCRLLLEKKN